MKRLLDPCGSLTPVWPLVVGAILLALLPLTVVETALAWRWPSWLENFVFLWSSLPCGASIEATRKQLDLDLPVRRWLGWTMCGTVLAAGIVVLLAASSLRAHGLATHVIGVTLAPMLYVMCLAWVPLASRLIASSKRAKEKPA